MANLGEYIKSVRAEMKHVSWPTRSQSTWFTVIVIMLSILTAYYLGFFDWVFTHLLDILI